MHIVIDGRSWQARAHERDGGKRLRTLLDALREIEGAHVAIGPSSGLGEIEGAPDVLLILTRAEPYDDAELEWADSFVSEGGGLLLLANHGDLPGRNPNDHASADAALASRFGIAIEIAWFQLPGHPRLAEMDGEQIEQHEVTAGPHAVVRRLVVNNSTSVRPGAASPLVRLRSDMVDLRDGRATEDRCLLVAAKAGQGLPASMSGRLIVGGDSGFVGSRETIWPGPGLLDMGDNRGLVLNAIEWLARS